jgi:hypothetical protein
MLTVVGGFGEFERELFERELARAAPELPNGVKLGRKPKLTPHQIREVIRRRQASMSTTRQLCALLLPPSVPAPRPELMRSGV